MQGDRDIALTGELQVYWTQVMCDQISNMVCTITMPQTSPSQIKVSGMIDTGAHITIISANTWPPLWPTMAWDLPLLASEGPHRAV